MAEKKLSEETKTVIVLVGSLSEIECVLKYLKTATAINPGFIFELKAREKTVEEVLADLNVCEISDEKYVERNVACMTEANLCQLEQILSERRGLTYTELGIRCAKDDFDYAFIGEDPKPQYYIPKKIGDINTKAKGTFRQRPFIITRPYM